MSVAPPDTVLAFWFSDEARPRWFDSTPAFDALVAERFLSTWQSAVEGRLSHWEESAEGSLALVIILDQFPLHMFRGRAEAFSSEALARQVAERAIAAGYDERLPAERKGFLYLPFMHAESLEDQERSVALYEKAGLQEGLRWARHHRDLIRRFGRFPHRNGVLGRVSTGEEEAYLRSESAFRG